MLNSLNFILPFFYPALGILVLIIALYVAWRRSKSVLPNLGVGEVQEGLDKWGKNKVE